jgi:hypothetical protein
MNTREAFYVHVHGEQLGPYTIRHLTHLLQSGLISTETLYWTEGMEQWQAITDLVPLPRARRPWLRAGLAAAVLAPLLGLAWFFGPTVLDGWREQTQREFTAEGAYWSGRGVVRSFLAQRREVPSFADFDAANVQLSEENHAATVRLAGQILGGAQSGRAAEWTVMLRFDPAEREWSAAGQETAAR